MIWLPITILLVYSGLLMAFITAWFRIREPNHQEGDKSQNYYSIIIPVRNEARNLKPLLNSLDMLDFSADRFEVIFIDDHSEDDSIEIFESHDSVAGLNMQWVFLKQETGKKSAIKYGIEQSKGTVIVTTDGDCIVPPGWLSSLESYYRNETTKMVFGPVGFHEEKKFFSALQQIEFMTLIGSGASSLQLKVPNMCNGANLSFLKEVFYEVGGYTQSQQIASGDDEFLMHAVYKKYPSGVFFNKNRTSLVNTYSSKNLSAFFSQRKRWASKWNYYKNNGARRMALFIAMVNIVVIYALLTTIISPSTILISVLMLKILLEAIFIIVVMKHHSKPFNLIHFLILEICYPFYVVIFGLASNFGSYVWKGRRL